MRLKSIVMSLAIMGFVLITQAIAQVPDTDTNLVDVSTAKVSGDGAAPAEVGYDSEQSSMAAAEQRDSTHWALLDRNPPSTNNCTVTRTTNCFFDTDHWVIPVPGAYFRFNFDLDCAPSTATLSLKHLSSAAASCPGGGYSPVDIRINGTLYRNNYDPASNHGGTHGWVNDSWNNVASYLREGANEIRITADSTICTHYWIQVFRLDTTGCACPVCPDYTSTLSRPTSTWQTRTGSIEPDGCVRYRVDLTGRREYTFKTGCGNGATANFDTTLQVRAPTCTQVAIDDDGCESTRSRITYRANSGDGYYFLKVAGYSNDSGNYTLAYRREPLCPNEICDESENACDCPQDCSPTCGDNGCCSSGENSCNCWQDCGTSCGDGCCNGGENSSNCCQDCGATCGDGICSTSCGENTSNCCQDCGATCGDGICSTSCGENTSNCCRDCGATCGDGVCSSSCGETPANCCQDCGATCGNGNCDSSCGETSSNCCQDCGPTCGDGACNCSESSSNCCQDCASCGDGVCDEACENNNTCPRDCPKVNPCQNGPYTIGGAVFTDCDDPLSVSLADLTVSVVCNGGYTCNTMIFGAQGLWSCSGVPCDTCTVTTPEACYVETALCPPDPCSDSVVITVDDDHLPINQSLAFHYGCVLHDMNGDGFPSILGDVPCFVDCLFFTSCPPQGACLGKYPCSCDCNHDGFCSIIGDVPCFVDCLFFDECPRPPRAQDAARGGAGRGFTIGGAVYADRADPLMTGVVGITVQLLDASGTSIGFTRTGPLGIWKIEALPAGIYDVVFETVNGDGSVGQVSTTIAVDEGNKVSMQSIQLHLPEESQDQEPQRRKVKRNSER